MAPEVTPTFDQITLQKEINYKVKFKTDYDINCGKTQFLFYFITILCDRPIHISLV